MTNAQWILKPDHPLPQWFLEAVSRYTPQSDGKYLAQILWQRGIQDPLILPQFLDPDVYQPTPASAFGQEMKRAIQRLHQAYSFKEKVTIWGDFDADGVTSTSVLWEGLGQFFPQYLQLDYYIPNRFTESHGLNKIGIDQLAVSGTQLIVTCDTGSTNREEIEYATALGIDIIITDHHTLPEERPSVRAIINSRYFADHHPLYHLSGVAVAYKLIEAMYDALPDIPRQPLESLLDLVAIGLIADLVELKGDCRYLAQQGIKQLQKQAENPTRFGVHYLLDLCKKSGDRATDISFGIGPRINAVSRIHGNAYFAVELLTSQDEKHCKKLAFETELANARRKSLQKSVTEDVRKKLADLDLSTTFVIILENEQWQSGVLGLVAGQIAQEYGRPTILLTTSDAENLTQNTIKLARGSARSIYQIDLYQLVQSQRHLLHRFGGHPYAAGLSLPVENLPLFKEGINQQLRKQIGELNLLCPQVEADIKVTVAELGYYLFRELKLLEPCGMGNPVPKLLIENCWFTDVWNRNIEDFKSKKVQYLKTTFKLWDRTVTEGFSGVWWGHSRDELPEKQTCDIIVELDFNTYNQKYEVRLVEIRLAQTEGVTVGASAVNVIDWRAQELSEIEDQSLHFLNICPISWNDLQKAYYQAINQNESLALAYSPASLSPEETWKKLVGMAKYLSRTRQPILSDKLKNELEMSDYTFKIALDFLSGLGFEFHLNNHLLSVQFHQSSQGNIALLMSRFLEALAEERFQQNYFYQLSLSEIKTILDSRYSLVSSDST